jgi:NarL family two-component system response regulator LiaR
MSTDDPIRVLVVDDHSIVREGLCAMLESKKGIRVIGDAGDGEEAVQRARSLNPDVILMDLKMPKKDGIAATRDIIKERPDARILVLTSFSDDEQIIESMRAGAMGYILKDANPDDLITAIHKVHAGETPLDPLVARRLIVNLTPSTESRLDNVMTARELEVLNLVVQGFSNQEIGQRLSISPRTAGTHISNMIHKAGVDNRTQLALLALKQGISSIYSGRSSD